MTEISAAEAKYRAHVYGLNSVCASAYTDALLNDGDAELWLRRHEAAIAAEKLIDLAGKRERALEARELGRPRRAVGKKLPPTCNTGVPLSDVPVVGYIDSADTDAAHC